MVVMDEVGEQRKFRLTQPHPEIPDSTLKWSYLELLTLVVLYY